MRLLIILLGLTGLLFSSDAKSADLESHIQEMFGGFKTSSYKRTENVRPAVAFVDDLHQKLLVSIDEGEVQHYRQILSAIIGRGAGVGGLKHPKKEDDTSYKATSQERAIMLSTIIDIERVREDRYDRRDYFGENFIPSKTSKLVSKALDQHARSVEKKSLEIFSFKESMDAPSNSDESLRTQCHNALQIDFSKRPTPAIHDRRFRDGIVTYFDVFSVVLAENRAMEEVSKWPPDYQILPLIYLSIHGPEAPLAKQKVIQVSKGTEIARLYPYWLDLIPTVDDLALKMSLFYKGLMLKEGEKEADIWDVIDALDMRIRRGGNEKFYCDALWNAYQTALTVCNGDLEILMKGRKDWRSGLKEQFFGTGYIFSEYKVLLNKITQDLLDKDYLDLNMIQSLSAKYWIQPEVKAALLGRLTLLADKADVLTLAPLLDRESEETDAKLILSGRLAELKAWDVLAEAVRTRANALAKVSPTIIATLKDRNALTLPRLKLMARSVGVEQFGEQLLRCGEVLSPSELPQFLIQLGQNRLTPASVREKLVKELLRIIPLDTEQPLKAYHEILRCSLSALDQLKSAQLLFERVAEMGQIGMLAELKQTLERRLNEIKATLTEYKKSIAEIDQYFIMYNNLMKQALTSAFTQERYGEILEVNYRYGKTITPFLMPLLAAAGELPLGFLLDLAHSSESDFFVNIAVVPKLKREVAGKEYEKRALEDMNKILEARKARVLPKK